MLFLQRRATALTVSLVLASLAGARLASARPRPQDYTPKDYLSDEESDKIRDALTPDERMNGPIQSVPIEILDDPPARHARPGFEPQSFRQECVVFDEDRAYFHFMFHWSPWECGACRHQTRALKAACFRQTESSHRTIL